MTQPIAAPTTRGRHSPHAVANRIIPLVLRAPLLHRLLSGALMLITFIGRVSGKRFTIPVTYLPVDGGVVFFSNRRWRRNLRGGAPVTLRLRGRDVRGVAEPDENRETVVREARAYLSRRGLGSARKIGLALDHGQEPTDPVLAAAVRDHVVVRVALPGYASGTVLHRRDARRRSGPSPSAGSSPGTPARHGSSSGRAAE